ncbi:MAG: hypothetical protein H6745_26580 [Deltaproteobacteria bacterium]|nr:hypothetical protein [Deltaproteobacteria bacterium]
MLLQPKSFVEPQTFFCRGFALRMSIHDCMGRFVDANALSLRDKPCFKCTQGQDNRANYSKT